MWTRSHDEKPFSFLSSRWVSPGPNVTFAFDHDFSGRCENPKRAFPTSSPSIPLVEGGVGRDHGPAAGMMGHDEAGGLRVLRPPAAVNVVVIFLLLDILHHVLERDERLVRHSHLETILIPCLYLSEDLACYRFMTLLPAAASGLITSPFVAVFVLWGPRSDGLNRGNVIEGGRRKKTGEESSTHPSSFNVSPP